METKVIYNKITNINFIRITSNDRIFELDIFELGNGWHTTISPFEKNNREYFEEILQKLKPIPKEYRKDIEIYVYKIKEELDKIKDNDIEKEIYMSNKKDYNNYKILEKIGLKKYKAVKDLEDVLGV
jgi:hypothetical protein